MTTLNLTDLATITGGAAGNPAAVLNRAQFNIMAAHMVPNGSGKPGWERHVVLNDSQLCHFPMPK